MLEKLIKSLSARSKWLKHLTCVKSEAVLDRVSMLSLCDVHRAAAARLSDPVQIIPC